MRTVRADRAVRSALSVEELSSLPGASRFGGSPAKIFRRGGRRSACRGDVSVHDCDTRRDAPSTSERRWYLTAGGTSILNSSVSHVYSQLILLVVQS